MDQNSIPKDLRPINIARTVPDEPRISPVATSGGPAVVAPGPGMVAIGGVSCAGPDGSVPVFYPGGVSDAGFLGLGYGAPPPAGMGQWATLRPVAVGNVSIGVSNPGGGFGYSSSLGNRVVANAVDVASNDSAGGLGCRPNLGQRGDGSGNREMAGLAVGSNLSARNQGSGGGVDHLSEEGGDESVSGKKVKFLCSFGGKILPRPSDGMLRYVGGQTRIISLRKDVSYNELVQKMVDTCGQPVVIKYQLPDEDLDALVSVSCPDDLDNMMEEYEKLVERSTDGSSKLRVFLFSSAELDASGMGQFVDLNDGGQRYVDAVNGSMDVGNSYIARKESIASATSTQNSDFGAAEAVDSGIHAHGGVTGPSSSMLSPKGNSATSQDAAAQKIVLTDPDATAFSDASLVSNPIVIPCPPQTLSSVQQVERSMPPPLQQHQVGYDLPQTTGTGMPQPMHPLHSYVAHPRQEIVNSTDYVAHPAQMGFSNPQLLGPVYSPHQVQDGNRVGAAQFIPAVHMTMMPSSSPVAMSPNMVQQLVQPQGARLERYPDENMLGPRLVQIPIDPSYNGYHPHLSHAIGGGVHGWQNVPQREHVVLSDGSVPQQQVVFPRVNARSEDCYMCQKALPHAHSDSLVQDQRDGRVSPLSELPSIHQSLHLEEAAKARATDQVAVTGPLAEDMIEQGAGAWPRVPNHMNHQMVRPLADPFLYSQNVEVRNENDRNTVGRADNSDQLEASVPYSFMELQGDAKAPYGLLSGAIPQSLVEDSTLQHALPTQHHIRQEVLLNKPSDMPHFTGLPIQGSDYPLQESLKESSGELTSVGSRENLAEYKTSNDHSRPVNEMMENLQISHPEVSANVEQNRLDDKIQQIVGREILMDNSFSQPQIFLDPNNCKQMGELPATAVFSYASSQPSETEFSQSTVFANPAYIPSYTGVHQLIGGDVNQRDHEVSRLEPAYINPPAVATGSSRLQQSPFLGGNVEATSGRMGDFQDSSNSLFSNQDPWNLRHDNGVLPPRPNKLIMRKDALGAKDPFVENNLGNSGDLVKDVILDGFPQPLNNLDSDFDTEQVQSSTAEELIKQELQATAEGVASSVLQSGTTISDSSVGKGNESTYLSNQDNGISNEDIDIQHKTKFEGIKSKAPEKANIGFPVSDGIGRLQIIKNCDLEELRELGSGTYGTVYHGKWRGTDVAIKRINNRCFAGKPSEHERLVDDFWNEAINLADLHHPNVVAFYGVVLDGPGGTVATVTEYMVNGSLRNALQKNERSLDKRKRLLIAMDVAFGMEYLHGRNIVHFDLKSDNLLVNLRDPHRPICKVGDLGLSKVKCQTLISGGVRGTLPWMAPELLNGGSSLVSEKVDVFSFGIVLWELLTGEEPYADLHYGAIIGGIVSNTLRPEVPESCDHEWKSLMERCWSPEPKERPSFTEVASDLRAMASKIPPKGQNTQQQAASAQPTLVQK